MKECILIIMVSCFSLSCADVDNALEQYQDGNYKEALQLYEEIEPKTADIWYNIGNCLYYLNRMPQALVAWRRAEKHSGSSLRKKILNNIDALYNEHGRSLDTTLRSYVVRILLSQKIPTWLFQLLFIFILFLSMFFILHRKRVFLFTICLLTSMALFFVVNFLYDHECSQTAVAMQTAMVYAGPAHTFPTRETLEAAREVAIVKKYNDWYKVQSVSLPYVNSHTVTGWIHESFVERV